MKVYAVVKTDIWLGDKIIELWEEECDAKAQAHIANLNLTAADRYYYNVKKMEVKGATE